MGIIFNNVLFKGEKNIINLQIEKNEIIGIINFDIKDIFNNIIKDGKVTFNKYVLNPNSSKEKKERLMNLISFVYDMPYHLYVIDEIKYNIKNLNIKKLNELLKKFDLKENILDRLCVDLSTSERKKVYLISVMLSDKDILYFENPSSYLDDKSKEMLVRELKRIKKNKIVLINSTDTNFLVKIADKILLKTTNQKYIFDSKYEVLKNEIILKDVGLYIPYIMYFINRVYKIKNIKLGYRDNLNDTVKDVYRHV